MPVNIGNKIKTEIKKKGMSTSEFARRINKSRENAYSIFKRKSIDTELLVVISKVLDVDFFQFYTKLSAENAKLKEEINQLKSVIKLLKKRK